MKKKYCPREIQQGSLTPLQKIAYNIFSKQRDRCNNPNNDRYDTYGARGIRIYYTRKELVDWLDKWYTGIPLKDIVIGRRDHDKGYSFDNIQLESKRDSSMEMNKRTSSYKNNSLKKRVGLFSKQTNECIAVFKSANDCSHFLGVNRSTIMRGSSTPRPKGSSKNSWYYRYVDENYNAIV